MFTRFSSTLSSRPYALADFRFGHYRPVVFHEANENSTAFGGRIAIGASYHSPDNLRVTCLSIMPAGQGERLIDAEERVVWHHGTKH